MNTLLSQLTGTLPLELEMSIEMDNAYNNNEYRYGNIENENSEENAQETVQESVEMQQELNLDNTEQQESANVNFVMYNPEPQNTEKTVEMANESTDATKEQKSEQTEANTQNMNGAEFLIFTGLSMCLNMQQVIFQHLQLLKILVM